MLTLKDNLIFYKELRINSVFKPIRKIDFDDKWIILLTFAAVILINMIFFHFIGNYISQSAFTRWKSINSDQIQSRNLHSVFMKTKATIYNGSIISNIQLWEIKPTTNDYYKAFSFGDSKKRREPRDSKSNEEFLSSGFLKFLVVYKPYSDNRVIINISYRFSSLLYGFLLLSFSLFFVFLSSIYIIKKKQKIFFSRVQLEEQKVALANLNIVKMATQVAHDIRTPLAVLDMVIHNDQAKIEKDEMPMLREAVSRIHNIAEDLLNKNASTNNNERDHSFNILELFNSILIEKKMILGQKSPVQLKLEYDKEIKDIEFSFEQISLYRVISNIINNAIEAIENEGFVFISLKQEASWLFLNVTDTGKGIPQHLLTKIGREGFTFGKKNGHGLGVHHAKSFIESKNGTFLIESTPGKGTSVSIKLPIV